MAPWAGSGLHKPTGCLAPGISVAAGSEEGRSAPPGDSPVDHLVLPETASITVNLKNVLPTDAQRRLASKAPPLSSAQ